MSNNAIEKLRALPGYLRRNSIFNAKDKEFDQKWIDNLVLYFDEEPAALSVNIPVLIWLAGEHGFGFTDGELEVRRDGSHAVRLT